MNRKKAIITTTFILFSLSLFSVFTYGELPNCYRIDGVQRVKQFTNYCGPAALTSVLCYEGENITQDIVGKSVYDAASGSTNGADMLLYARDKGYAAYSWDSSISDVKKKIATGAPVIVLQQNSVVDTSGHYRVLTGYDDAQSKFYVMDPYYDNITELSYKDCDKLWKSMGYWALVIVPAKKDTFEAELSKDNPVVHMDLSYALYKQKDYDKALKEAKMALALEPSNSYAISLVNKINRASGAGKRH